MFIAVCPVNIKFFFKQRVNRGVQAERKAGRAAYAKPPIKVKA